MQILSRPDPGWARPWIGAPYAPHPAPAGYSCWSLVLEAGRALGFEFKTFPWPEADPSPFARAALMESAASNPAFIETPPPQPRRWPRHPAIVLFEIGGRPLHVGLTDGWGDVLHVMAGLPASLQRLADPDLPGPRRFYVPA